MKVLKAQIIIIDPIGVDHPHRHDTRPEGCRIKCRLFEIDDGDSVMKETRGKIDPSIDPCTL